MKRLITFFGIVLLATAAFRIAAQTTGTAKLTVHSAAPTTSLLAGKTPATFTGLAGWTTVAKEDFEGGPDECGTGCYFGGVGITTAMSHAGGTHALENDISGDEFDTKFGKTTPVASEYYISGWRFDTPMPSQGTDYYLARAYANFPNGNTQDCKFDPQDSSLDYLTLSAPANLICEGTGPFNQHNAFWGEAGGTTSTLSPGQWAQEEFWLRPSSCSGNSMNTDGFFRMYKDGALVVKVDATTASAGRIGGCPSMNSAPNMGLEFGGTLTYMMNSGSGSVAGPCLPNGSGGTQVRCRPFNACPAKQSNGHPCWGSQANFKVFEDDIIFLKR